MANLSLTAKTQSVSESTAGMFSSMMPKMLLLYELHPTLKRSYSQSGSSEIWVL